MTRVGEIDWFQEGEKWVVADVDNGTVYGRYANENDALAVVTEYRWSGRLPDLPTPTFANGTRVSFDADGPVEGEQVEVTGEVVETKFLATGEWVVIDSGLPPTFYGAESRWQVQPESIRVIDIAEEA